MQLQQWVVVSYLLSVVATSQDPGSHSAMTHEENIVRSAYAKLAYAARIGAMRDLIDEVMGKPASEDSVAFARRMEDIEIGFELSSLRVGDFADIADVMYADLVTKPNGEDVLMVGTGNWGFKTEELKETWSIIATPSWTKSQILLQDWNMPFAKAFKMAKEAGDEDLSPYTRYASVSVKATFQGRSRSYHALFLFGTDSAGKERVLPVDTVTGTALSFYIANSAYPGTLLETDLRKIPVVAQWLRENVVAGAVAGKREVTCNLETLRCGLAMEDVQRALGEIR
jgi:hypothetical protein